MSNATSLVLESNATLPRHGPSGWIYRYPVQMHSLPYETVNLFWWQQWVANHWTWGLYAGLFYILTIFTLQRWMQNRPAMNLKRTLFLWNFGLGMFSLVAFVRTAPGLLRNVGESNGFYSSLCRRTGLDRPTEFWTVLFLLSKLVEFGDTVLTVLRKRPLVFLQWYHHVATMITCWILLPALEPITWWYMVLNFGVHALMYPYFALKSIGYRIPKIFADIITTAEFSQMIIGLAINIISAYYKQMDGNCARTEMSIKVFCLLYGSFFLLFGKLFYDSVVKRHKSKTKTGGSESSGILLMGSCDDNEASVVEVDKKEKLE